MTSYPDESMTGAGADDDQIDWHEVVDYVCVGPGDTALAVALAVVDAGRDVYLTGRAPAVDGTVVGRFGLTDPDSVAFVTSLTADVDPSTLPVAPALLPAHVETGPAEAPFDFRGAELRNWATACVSSPYGLLCTAPAGIGPVPVAVGVCDRRDAGAWLAQRADAAGLVAEPASRLDRLVFVGGRAVGAVIETDSGRLVVGAERGVVFATGGPVGLPMLSEEQLSDGGVQLAVVRRAVSRFARLELVTGNGG